MTTQQQKQHHHYGGDKFGSQLPASHITINNNKNNKKCPKDRRLHHRRRSINKRYVGGRKGQDGGDGGGAGGGGGRLSWQLPKSSIDEYIKWIQEKPEKDQTSNEQRFLWKYMIRRLDNSNNNSNSNGSVSGGTTSRVTNKCIQERIQEYVDRLQSTKPLPHERTNQEEQFIRLYYQRRKDHKAQKKQQQVSCSDHNDETMVSWMRINGINNINGSSSSSNIGDSDDVIHYNDSYDDNNINSNSNYKGLEPTASLASLHESMMKLGLSSDKLKHVRFVDE